MGRQKFLAGSHWLCEVINWYASNNFPARVKSNGSWKFQESLSEKLMLWVQYQRPILPYWGKFMLLWFEYIGFGFDCGGGCGYCVGSICKGTEVPVILTPNAWLPC